MLASIKCGCPTDARLSLWTDRLLPFPIDDKLTGVDPLVRICLPFDIGMGRTNDINFKASFGISQHICIDVASIRAPADEATSGFLANQPE